MAAFGTGAGRPLTGRGGSPGFRFTLYALLSVVAMYLDQRAHYLEQLRYVLQAAAYPIQLAVSSPSAAWHWIRDSVQSREALQTENARLRTQQRELELRAMRYEALARENGDLRGLRDALPPVAERWLAAEIVNIQLSSLQQRLLIDRGGVNGVFKGQAVLDDKGLIGQTTHVGPWSAEVIMITDPEHAVPVRVERTGLRTIAVGAGDATSLALPYLPGNADIRSGDLLVTSGLGGVFPEGYPVARVTEVHRDAVQPLAQVRAQPLAHVDSDSEVMLVWFHGGHPAVPAPVADSLGELHSGNASMQPQNAPPKLRPAPAQPDAARPQAAPPQGTPSPGVPSPGAPSPGAPSPGAPSPGAPSQGVPRPQSAPSHPLPATQATAAVRTQSPPKGGGKAPENAAAPAVTPAATAPAAATTPDQGRP